MHQNFAMAQMPIIVSTDNAAGNPHTTYTIRQLICSSDGYGTEMPP